LDFIGKGSGAMIQSMTGYGTISLQQEGTTVAVEVRTVNHRFLDLHVRLGREYGSLEAAVSQLVRNVIRRGRVDVSVVIQAQVPAECLISLSTAKGYLEAAAHLRDELHLDGALDIKTLLTLPGVLQNQNLFSQEPSIGSAPFRELTLAAVRQALETVLQMRLHEGHVLDAELKSHLESVRVKVAAIRAYMPSVLLEYRQRLDERLKYLLPMITPDPQRLAQEVALLAEKSDISEEITRMESHIDQFASVLADGREAGKKMDFLLQEMQREVNTMLSKTGNLEVTRHGIALKADIEKLREQVQNVE
jgi:uncharacterized protein (TIGR00255 family)